MAIFLISGSSGFIGKYLTQYLRQKGQEVRCLVRRKPKQSGEFFWDPLRNQIDPQALKEVDCVINLAGANITKWIWTPHYRHQILISRICSTQLLVETIKKGSHPPVFLSASAVGYYGADCGPSPVTEDASPGDDFLARVALQWELVARELEPWTRVVILRLGLVLHPSGGILRTLKNIFQWGLGGYIGSGEQYWSWITLEDVCQAIVFLIEHQQLQGPFNLTTPNPVQQKEFVELLSQTTQRSCWCHVPSWVLKLLPGDMGTCLFLSNIHAIPYRLSSSGFSFLFGDLRKAFQHFFGNE